MCLRTVRADSGFFDGSFLDFLEERALPDVVVARLTTPLKRKCAGIKDCTCIDEHHAAGEFPVKLFGCPHTLSGCSLAVRSSALVHLL